MKWIILLFIAITWFSTTQAVAASCEHVLTDCLQSDVRWASCFEDRVVSCRQSRIRPPNFIKQMMNSSQEVEVSPTLKHRLHIPSSALQRGRRNVSDEEVQVVATVINSTYFKLWTPRQGRGRMFIPTVPAHRQGTVMGGLVLAVMVGNSPLRNLSQPVKLTFKKTYNNSSKQKQRGECVYWEELNDGTGYWSIDGCDTSDHGTESICSCNHLSFFAVLVNPVLSVDEIHSVSLTYITYIGSALSVFFTVISLFIYICLQRRRPEKAISVHMHLTGALFCLHLSFLLCSFWVLRLKENEESRVCQFLGLFLHWSLLATFSWMALEGFHLYLLLVRVFNIYVSRYLLKLSMVGWGFPTVIAVVCGISGVYGKYSLQMNDTKNHSLTAEICWLNSSFPQMLVVSFITNVAFPCLVILYNSCMLGLVMFKLWGIRGGSGGTESSSGRKEMNKEKRSRLWKDCATLLGLSCVLGLPWGLASTTYISLPGIYVFTILNSLQGVFMFIWSMALTCKSRSDRNSSIRDPSSQKMMTTSFNN
ncbi:adhesion G-protein coupled receptor G1 [Lates calcarifer]|uniref:Adhesion G-protein coupled receptor G1 n=1 Tax=Lates calcarifer TaxID=8187 RepID=A0A4W6FYN1_LATCA|nr:adhesion G-protein coupled receptor G1 [Lates calcarifer]